MKLKMKDVEGKKQATEVLLEEMGVQRSEAEAQQVLNFVSVSPAHYSRCWLLFVLGVADSLHHPLMS